MIEQIIKLRRRGMSFRKIAKEIDSTVGKVQYAWNKYNQNSEINGSNVVMACESEEQTVVATSKKWKRKGFLKAWLISSEKVYVFWRTTDEQLMTIKQYEQNDNGPVNHVLRIYDVTCILFNGQNAHSFFEVIVPENQKHWSINGLKENRCYLIEYGIKLGNQPFFPIMQSEAIHMPRKSIKPNDYTLKYDLENYEKGAMQKPNWIEHVSTYSYYEETERKGSK